MARRYHQSKADRMDESLGERRGKESSKKQSYKSRRHESAGMKKAMDHEDHPSKHMGHGEFANLPRHEIFQKYPKEKYNYGAYDDTIYGIDQVDTESADKVKHYRSRQK